MHEIRAFVAHSFSTNDKGVIQIFLDHFRTLERAYPNFTWDHAEPAEPAPLSQKVLEKIEGKNVFIGICTRKELVVAPSGLKKIWYSNSLQVNPTDVAFKTSDWLIQEIGLAVGRKMSIILFLEEEVREPGGLYGDMEFIRFSREHPRDSFHKLLQMLSTLTPKTGAVATPAEAKPPAEQSESDSPTEGENFEPNPDWTEDDYQRAAFRTVIRNNDEGLRKIDASYRASKFAHSDSVAIWEAELEYFRLLFDKKGNFRRVQELAEEHPNSAQILNTLSRWGNGPAAGGCGL